eukprot:CAMPEP_0116825298 /NCGR_PEP_ID=MMETSP0418-20121206/1884_1 /TAXON_ID=1158023 /ORGANISM="Astrosyne radiata, Strain 13vi08-1A" /LENGTH=353 /DNA_ID=CAMNT_0004453783 /DNA_START=334 /DNA_END=1395 /DNA_ORIENTATION=+
MGDAPKPETLFKFNKLVVDSIPSILECSTISTCLRFEILAVVNETVPLSFTLANLSSLMASQAEAYDKLPPGGVYAFAKESQWINETAIICSDEEAVGTLTTKWCITKGVQDVCRHLCLVTTALDPKPNKNKPPKAIEFQPFDSNMAKVLAQFKNIANITRGPVCKTLLDAALHAGKLARDQTSVPDIAPLRDFVGRMPPDVLARTAVEAVRKVAVEGTVAACAERIQAMTMSKSIVQFRAQAQRLAKSPEELKWIRQQIHAPTEDLRRAKEINTKLILRELATDLQERRDTTKLRAFDSAAQDNAGDIRSMHQQVFGLQERREDYREEPPSILEGGSKRGCVTNQPASVSFE